MRARCWVAGYDFGAWIGMQPLMRRPEINAFISVSPPANLYDFTFLAPCPNSGLFIQGNQDDFVPQDQVFKLVEKLRAQRGIDIDYHVIESANHFFTGKEKELEGSIRSYIEAAPQGPAAPRKKRNLRSRSRTKTSKWTSKNSSIPWTPRTAKRRTRAEARQQ